MRRLFLGAVLATAVAFPAAAAAETTSPIQSVKANALPLIHLPAAAPSTICLVDTGVDINPDTKDAIVERTSFGNASVEDASPVKHGTQMAMVMAAPINGWGMVGAWPAAKIFSVHVLGVTYFPRGIDECRRQAPRLNIKVINLSFGAPGILPGDDPQLINSILSANAVGLNVVAAAGNDGGALDAPANHPGAFAVGGVDKDGFFCRYGEAGSANGRELDINALGCDLNLAFPDTGLGARGGATSEATAFVSASLAALRSYRPDLTPEAAERIFLDSASSTPAGRFINVEGAFRSAGLSGIWDLAGSRTVSASSGGVTSSSTTQTSASPSKAEVTSPTEAKAQSQIKLEGPLVRPKVKVVRQGRRVAVRALNRPKEASLVLVVKARGKIRTIKRRSGQIVFTPPRGAQVRALFERGKSRSELIRVQKKWA